MKHGLRRSILLLYPRRVRQRHGVEILALIDEIIEREQRTHAGLLLRLAVDGFLQRLASTATIWTVVVVLGTTSLGGLVISDLASARALHHLPRAAQTHPSTHRHPHHKGYHQTTGG